MAFYDSVKDDIRDETGATTDDDDDSMPFDQLKDEAEEREDPEESETSSDTDIEVLGDGGLDDTENSGTAAGGAEPQAAAPQDTAPQQSASEEGTGQPQSDAADHSSQVSATGTAGGEEGAPDTVDVLRRIEDQNQEILDVLRGIKRSLE
ncbi:MAG: hypothetical protein SVY41_00170 [Candidatus Nanohaloarchaea archaeon]|nr:hypothetical protein [Candidatus Nanohaloarchaea archaeon]